MHCYKTNVLDINTAIIRMKHSKQLPSQIKTWTFIVSLLDECITCNGNRSFSLSDHLTFFVALCHLPISHERHNWAIEWNIRHPNSRCDQRQCAIAHCHTLQIMLTKRKQRMLGRLAFQLYLLSSHASFQLSIKAWLRTSCILRVSVLHYGVCRLHVQVVFP